MIIRNMVITITHNLGNPIAHHSECKGIHNFYNAKNGNLLLFFLKIFVVEQKFPPGKIVNIFLPIFLAYVLGAQKNVSLRQFF